ncbi:hypothetical protein DVH24_017696 [Malus domestica]|uniref:Uncharacterized protein n=1 Tax=Malus domestica TaxID=3750 RepID=A0A498KGX6_MALDO|nr:hypothetical protein DVH24_017696 [Malus domestica]
MAALAAGTRRPWVGLGAAVWVQIAAGNAYTFPLYSHSLKSVLGFNQQQLTMLGVANDIGENFGLIPGFVSKKHPPWLILLIGALASIWRGRLNEGHDSSDVPLLLTEGEGGVNEKRKLGEDFKFIEAVVKADFWLLFFVFFFGVGSGVTVLNNLAQIGVAQGFDDTTFLLSLFGVGNFVGRLGGGFVSERFVRSKTIPRTVWMTCTQIIMFATYLLFPSAINATFCTATGILGVCYGVQFSVMISTVSELFGLKDFGTLYNFMALGNPLGALLFSGLLAGYVYDNEAAKQQGIHLYGTNVSCVGPNCFRLTFLVLAAVCFVGSILSIVLSLRIKPFYQNLYSGGSVGVLPNTNQQDQGAASAS